MTQNVFAMRPEVRAEYAEVRARLGGDAEFLTRLERFFTELRDPLVALYGDDQRFPAQFAALLDAMAATARGRDADLRRHDHYREITPRWLLRAQGGGSVCYVVRFAGTRDGVIATGMLVAGPYVTKSRSRNSDSLITRPNPLSLLALRGQVSTTLPP